MIRIYIYFIIICGISCVRHLHINCNKESLNLCRQIQFNKPNIQWDEWGVIVLLYAAGVLSWVAACVNWMEASGWVEVDTMHSRSKIFKQRMTIS